MFRNLLVALLLTTPLFAQKKALTLDAIYHPEQKLAFSGAVQSGFEWLDDSTFVWPKKDVKGDFVAWRVYDVKSGKDSALFDVAKFEKALIALGVPAADAKKKATSDDLVFDAKKDGLVVAINDDLYFYAPKRGIAVRLTTANGEEEVPAFSPDGQRVAFVRNNDMYVVDLSGREVRLTTDGSAEILNGKLDYVYQEEVYGRGEWRGYWWSDDSSRIAYLQLDERPVPEFTVVDHVPYRLGLNVYDYPKAGDPNPRARLFTVAANGGKPVEVDTNRYSAGEHLIVNVAWAPSGELTHQIQNREQTWLDLNIGTIDGKSRTILRETTKAWVEPLGAPEWLADGSFLWQSERSGWRHLHHYKADGTLVRQVTTGEWEVRDLHGADGQYVYFSGTERSPIGLDVYRVKLDGSGMQRLSDAAGRHGAVFNPSLTRYVDKWSDVKTPDQIRVHGSDGKVVRVVDENRVALLAEHELPQPEFLQVRTRDGFTMEALMIRPPGFDPSKKYPVYQYLYAGPHAQQVLNQWRGQFMLFNQLVAQQGVVVFMVDNRTASGKGAVSAWPVYKNFGELELQDEEDALRWLKTQPYIDGERILINGWSYGGFMVLYAMTHSQSFKAGIAGGSVVDWRDYDSIYTERYMLMPQNNPDGYRKSSPRFDAQNLHGNLLLVHGTTDDNVHVQNTIQMAHELQQLGTPFEMMLLPKAKHSVTDKETQYFLQKIVLEFVKRQLLE